LRVFADPVKKIVGMAHSGWRGTVGKIGKVTVEKMVSYFDCKKEDIICALNILILSKNFL